MPLGRAGKRELLEELHGATQSLRRLARLIALLPDWRVPPRHAQPKKPGDFPVRRLGLGDMRAKPDSAKDCANDLADQARADIAAIFADRLHAYFHRHDPDHHQAVDRVRALFAAAYGND